MQQMTTENFEEEKKEEPAQRLRKRVSSHKVIKTQATAVSTRRTNGFAAAHGMFKDAFEEILEETVALSHYVTNSYRSYKQNSVQTDHEL